MTTRFDESLSTLVHAISDMLGPDAVDAATFLRDAGGQLAVILDLELDDRQIEEISAVIHAQLGNYAREEDVLRDRNGFGASRLIKEGATGRRIRINDRSIAFLDRRTVGADWLLPPLRPHGIPRIAFASLKGGVGRSTALAVMAAYLSSRGLRVLAVDLDLEAPGIGTMLIDANATPRFGTLDYLVENNISGIDNDFLADFVGNSFLGASGAQVSVLPAIGTATLENPAGAISKLSRAYLEDVLSDGSTVSLTEQLQKMLNDLTVSNSYDVVLIDARAGLHETTAAALLGLGAELLMFGLNEPQTFLGYKLLLSHLALFHEDSKSEWRDRIQFVQAKASGDPKDTSEAEDRFADLYAMLYDAADADEASETLTEDDFEMVWADDDTEVLMADYREPSVVHVLDDSRYRGFNPLNDRTLLSSELFATTFGELLEWVDNTIPALVESSDGD